MISGETLEKIAIAEGLTHAAYRGPASEWALFPAAVFLLLSVAGMAQGQTNQENQDKVRLNFRFDDYSSRSDTEFEKRLIGIFREKGLKLTYGVIPAAGERELEAGPQEYLPLDSAKGSILIEAMDAGVLEVMMHGHHHQVNAPLKGGRGSEWIGLSLEEQTAKLKEGRAILEGVLGRPVTTFCPPWNNYDANTVRALEATGFTLLSARGRGHDVAGSKMAYVPTTCGLRDARKAIELAERFPGSDPIVVLTFHAFDFKEVDTKRGYTTVDEFTALLDWVKGRSVEVVTFADLAARGGALGSGRFVANRAYLASRFYNLAPGPLLGPAFPGVYLDERTALALARDRWMHLGLGGGACLLLTGAAGWFAFGAAFRRRRLLGFAAAVLLGLLLPAYAAKTLSSGGELYLRSTMAGLAAFGLGLGGAVSLARARRGTTA